MSTTIPAASVIPPGTIPATTPRQFTQSSEGIQLAADIYRRASAEQTANGANDVLWKGYGTLLNNARTTDDEKAVVRYGDALAHITFANQEHNRLAFQVMSSLANPVSGPVGTVLGKIIHDTANNVKLAHTANEALWKGYDVILAHPETTDLEKALAGLGEAISHQTLKETEHNLIGYSIIGSISSTLAGASGPVIAAAAYKAAQNVKLADSANQVFWKGYTAIINDPQASPEVKAIARLGDAVSHITMNTTEHNRVGYPLFRIMSNPPTGHTSNIIAQAAYDAANNVQYAESANRVFWSAYTEILNTPGLSPTMKAVATLGDAISRNSMQHTEHNRVNYPLFKIMCAPINSTVSRAIVDAASVAAGNTNSQETRAIVFREGFNTLIANADVSGMQKALAQKGLEIDHKPHLTSEDANTLRSMLMDLIKDSMEAADGIHNNAANPAKLRARVKGLQDSITKEQSEIKRLEQEIADAQPGYAALIDSHNNNVGKFNKVTKINKYLFLGGIAGGLAALALRQPLLLIPAGIAALSRLYLGSVQKKLNTSYVAYKDAEMSIARKTMQTESHRQKTEFYQMELDILKPQVDVLDMADAANGKKSEDAPTIIADSNDADLDDVVIIGGLKLEKKKKEIIGADHPSESSDKASSR